VPEDALLSAMAHDKKNRMARVRFALPRAIGRMSPEGGWTREAEEVAIRSALATIS
jgi:3-dehydroquinate synthetase